MTGFRNAIFCCLLLLAVVPRAEAWNATGHMVLAAVAYRQLSPEERATVDQILTHHPEVERWDADRTEHESSLSVGEYRFLRASVWPDQIKHKKGWPDHASWHYADFPLTGPHSPPAPDPGAEHNILAGIRENRATLSSPSSSPEEKAIALSWVLHLLGDLHQPLHLGTAITPEHPAPDGDYGGNDTKVIVDSHRPVRLHELWDGLLGKSKDPDKADHQAVVLVQDDLPQGGRVTGSEEDWAQESRALAQRKAYPPAVWSSGGEPVPVERAYLQQAKKIAELQVFLGGMRLAKVLRATVR